MVKLVVKYTLIFFSGQLSMSESHYMPDMKKTKPGIELGMQLEFDEIM